MIKCQDIEQFILKEYNKLANVVRKHVEAPGTLFVGDTFECSKQMAEYLTGKNDKGKTVVKILQVEPVEQPKIEELKKAYIKTTKKKTSK